MHPLHAVTVLCLLALALPGLACWGPRWDSLKVTWGVNPLSSVYFDYLPRTVSEAAGEGFVVFDQHGCSDSTSAWRGIRYVKDNDYSVILLFDKNGYIAGIQTSMHQNDNGWPSRLPFIQDGGRWTVTAYFVDPSIICSEGRSSEDFNEQGTGTDLYLQLTALPEQSQIMPKEETGLSGTQWIKGKCLPTMGQHYWYNIHEDMDCDDFFPAFLLYNSGRLNAFGWALQGDLSSPRYEHPTPEVFPKFYVTVPQCLYTAGKLSTQHIYLDSTPRTNFC